MLLALDLASETGWAVVDPTAYRPVSDLEAAGGNGPAKPLSGTFRTRGAELGEFLHRFDLWLSDAITVHKPTHLIFEAPLVRVDAKTGGVAIDAARKTLGLAAVTEMVAYRRDIGWVREAHNATVHKHFIGLGSGKSKDLKARTVERCQRLGWDIVNHNQADAVALADYAVSIIRKAKALRRSA